MSTNYPTNIDTFTNPTATDSMSVVPHASQHANANDALVAIQTKVGVNNSAVQTSHDYKLGEVTGSDRAVGKTATQTLANKTLTSPQINFGGDATGDIYYRNAGGATTRLPIGSAGNILQVSSGGIPEYVPNPAAADASTTIKGVVEIATTAEITAGDTLGGTGARLVVPADAVGSAGANKIVQFNSSGQYPAADGSLITNLSGIAHTVNADENLNDFHTFQIPMIGTSATTLNGWNLTTFTSTQSAGNVIQMSGSTSVAVLANCLLPGTGAQLNYRYNESKIIRLKVRLRFIDTSDRKGFGLSIAGGDIHTAHTDTTNGEVRFILNGTTLYAQNANGTATFTDVTSGITVTNWNTYEIVFTPGVDIKYYINGNLVATHTTNLPTTGTPLIAYGVNTNGRQIQTTFPVVSIQN